MKWGKLATVLVLLISNTGGRLVRVEVGGGGGGVTDGFTLYIGVG